MVLTHEGGVSEDHYTLRFDSEQRISEAVVSAVADYTGADRESLPPIGQSINPDGLNVLFENDAEGSCPGGCVTFSYYKHTVVVQSTGLILVKSN